jgi:hypothetical protein
MIVRVANLLQMVVILKVANSPSLSNERKKRANLNELNE